MTDTQTVDIEKTAIGTLDPNMTQMQPQAEATQYSANVDCPVCKTPNPPSETYCIDCGFLLNAEPVQVEEVPQQPSAGTLVSSDGTREFSLRVGENSVGRENADILLTHNSVSRKHAKVVIENGKAFVEDLGSTNGTCVDGSKIESGKRAELKDGCEVMFGSSVVKYKAAEVVETDAEDAEIEEPETEPETNQEDAELEVSSEEQVIESAEPANVGAFVSKDGATRLEIMAGVNTIGRRQGDNMIVIPDPYCSGKHAEISVENGIFALTDVGSTNGTQVNGVKLEANAPKVVSAGDEITFGETVFVLEVA